MQNKSTNWLAIAAAALATFMLGWLWYGVLFSDVWMAGNGMTMGADEHSIVKDGVTHTMSFSPMIINFIVLLVNAFFMSWLLRKTNSTNLKDGVTIGFFIGIIMFLGIYVGNSYALNDISLSICDGLYALILWTIVGAIIGGWPKKSA